MKFPYLVQRLKAQYKDIAPNRKGVDQVCSCDYMGAAEFEYGALPLALERMRSAGDKIKLIEIPAVEDENPALVFVGLEEYKDDALRFFREEFKGVHHHLKERTAIRSKYFEKGSDYYKPIIGWWAVDESRGGEFITPWAIFDDIEIGKAWFQALKS